MLKRLAYSSLGLVYSAKYALAEIDPGLNKVDAGLKGSNNDDPVDAVQKLITYFLSLLAIVAVIYAMYGGFLILTDGGGDERNAKGRKVIINAIIGIVVIFLAWTIVKLVFDVLGGDVTT